MRNSITLLSISICLLIPGSFQAEGPKATLRRGVFPTYPACAIEKRVQGTVRIKTVLDAGGKVTAAVPLGSHDEPIVFPKVKTEAQICYECLCLAAQKAASLWTFEEGAEGREIVIKFHFELVDDASAEDLYPVFVAPSEVRVKGQVPITNTSVSGTKRKSN